MSDSDSDDSLLCPSALSTTRTASMRNSNDNDDDDDVLRAIEASKATFAAEKERNKSLSLLDNDSEDEDEILEVLAPIHVIKKEASKGNKSPTVRPRLTPSGVKPSDPVDLADDDSSEDDLNIGLSLAERLGAKRAPPSFASRCKTDLSSDDHNQDGVAVSKKAPPVTALSMRKPVARLIDYVEFSSSSDDEPALQRAPTASTLAKPDTLGKKASAPGDCKPSLAPAKRSDLGRFESTDNESNDSFSDLEEKLAKSSSSSRNMTLLSNEDDDTDDDDSLSNGVHKKPRAIANKKVPRASSSRSNEQLHRRQERPRKLQNDQKERERQEKQMRKEREKQERQQRQARKEQEKLERQRERKAKQAADQAAKESRKRRRAEAAQATGKHARDEIAVLMEPELFRNDTLTLKAELKEARYRLLEYPSGLGCNALQFIRKDFKDGGAEDAIKQLHAGNKEGYVHLPIMAVVFDKPEDFILLLERPDHEEDDDYPELMTWLLGVEAGWRAAWKVPADQRPRTLLFLNRVKEALDKMWVKYRSRGQGRGSKAPPTAEELYDAITWVLIEFNVECIHCSSNEDVSNHIKKMTRMLSEEPYQRQVTDLECVKKIKAGCSDADPIEERSTDCWKRQLQQVPKISEKVALSLVQYYPTARSLWLKYQDENLSETEKSLLLAECCGTGRRHAKLSNYIYRIMTSKDPNEMLR